MIFQVLYSATETGGGRSVLYETPSFREAVKTARHHMQRRPFRAHDGWRRSKAWQWAWVRGVFPCFERYEIEVKP